VREEVSIELGFQFGDEIVSPNWSAASYGFLMRLLFHFQQRTHHEGTRHGFWRTHVSTQGHTGAITTPANFPGRRNPLMTARLHHPSTATPHQAVRFGQAETDNQSAGKLRLGFQPCAAAQAPRPFLGNRILLRSPLARFPRTSLPIGAPAGPVKTASAAADGHMLEPEA
jgi:hypothetical protein